MTLFVLAAFAAGVITGGLLIRFVSARAALGLGLAVIAVSHRVSRSLALWAAPK